VTQPPPDLAAAIERLRRTLAELRVSQELMVESLRQLQTAIAFREHPELTELDAMLDNLYPEARP